jgi:hypothetical protein
MKPVLTAPPVAAEAAEAGAAAKDTGAGVVVEAKAPAEPASAIRASRGRGGDADSGLSRRKQQIGPTTRSKAEDASPTLSVRL